MKYLLPLSESGIVSHSVVPIGLVCDYGEGDKKLLQNFSREISRDRSWMETAHYGDDRLVVVVGLSMSDLLVLPHGVNFSIIPSRNICFH
jgi:hypothetical protein